MPGSDRPPWEPIIVLGALILALALVAARWIIWRPNTSTRPPLTQPIGPVNWRFGESWASTLTTFSAFVGTVLASQVLPVEGLYLSSNGFAVLSLLFFFASLLAPFVYTATASRASPVPEPPDSSTTPGYQGKVLTYLLATAITLWAALGEVTLIAFMAAELTRRGAVFYVFAAVLVGVGALMLRYSWVNIRWVLEIQAEHQRRKSLTGVAPEPRPSWTVL
jgi:hypothetical protein